MKLTEEPCAKRRYESYAEALGALAKVRGKDVVNGSVYTCERCEGFHISKRRFTLNKPKGRGKYRKGLT